MIMENLENLRLLAFMVLLIGATLIYSKYSEAATASAQPQAQITYVGELPHVVVTAPRPTEIADNLTPIR